MANYLFSSVENGSTEAEQITCIDKGVTFVTTCTPIEFAFDHLLINFSEFLVLFHGANPSLHSSHDTNAIVNS